MTADIIPISVEPRPVEIRPGDRVQHRTTLEEGIVFTMTATHARVAICGRLVTCELAEWRPV